MNKEIPALVILPDNYINDTIHYPTIYLLHGYGGNYSSWLKVINELKFASDSCKMIIICPDGGFDSYYINSPIDSASKYETFISTELVQAIDSDYRTINSNQARAITGFSMGGHGALYLAIKHQNVFGLAGSMSGVVDLTKTTVPTVVTKVIGNRTTYPERWHNYSVINMTNQITDSTLAIIIDCGTNDPFINSNRELHQKLQQQNITHTYHETSGKHNWNYWRKAVVGQIGVFSGLFTKKAQQKTR
jgi:S-formylglutathione hydrolase FrmB